MPETLTKSHRRDGLSDAQHMHTDGLVISQDLIEEFLVHLKKKGRTTETVSTYRSFLKRICSRLPKDMMITRTTLADVWEKMESEGFAASTINGAISAANSLLEYCDRRDLMMSLHARDENVYTPEMTRGEYQRLLQAARSRGKARVYLLVKLFACTGINTNELCYLTAEAVHNGAVVVDDVEDSDEGEIHLPQCICEELEGYMKSQNITSGPIFLNQSGRLLSRSIITREISELSDIAQVPREKCNVRCLQRLYQTTQKNIEKNIFLQRQQLHDYMIYQEQTIVGWKSSVL